MIMAVVAEEKRLECLGFEIWVNSFQAKIGLGYWGRDNYQTRVFIMNFLKGKNSFYRF